MSFLFQDCEIIGSSFTCGRSFCSDFKSPSAASQLGWLGFSLTVIPSQQGGQVTVVAVLDAFFLLHYRISNPTPKTAAGKALVHVSLPQAHWTFVAEQGLSAAVCDHGVGIHLWDETYCMWRGSWLFCSRICHTYKCKSVWSTVLPIHWVAMGKLEDWIRCVHTQIFWNTCTHSMKKTLSYHAVKGCCQGVVTVP